MTYKQDGVERICAICSSQILQGEYMMDLFRKDSLLEGSTTRVEWAHEECVRKSVERWLRKKRGIV